MTEHPHATAKLGGHPIHPMLIPFPIAAFIGAFVTDLVFAFSGDPFWARMSFYLLSAGLVLGALAAIAGFTDFFGDRLIRQHKTAWHHMIGNVLVVLLQITNWLVRAGPDDADILPVGLILSGVVTVLLLYTGWKGGELVYHYRTGVRNDSQSADLRGDPNTLK